MSEAVTALQLHNPRPERRRPQNPERRTEHREKKERTRKELTALNPKPLNMAMDLQEDGFSARVFELFRVKSSGLGFRD